MRRRSPASAGPLPPLPPQTQLPPLRPRGACPWVYLRRCRRGFPPRQAPRPADPSAPRRARSALNPVLACAGGGSCDAPHARNRVAPCEESTCAVRPPPPGQCRPPAAAGVPRPPRPCQAGRGSDPLSSVAPCGPPVPAPHATGCPPERAHSLLAWDPCPRLPLPLPLQRGRGGPPRRPACSVIADSNRRWPSPPVASPRGAHLFPRPEPHARAHAVALVAPEPALIAEDRHLRPALGAQQPVPAARRGSALRRVPHTTSGPWRGTRAPLRLNSGWCKRCLSVQATGALHPHGAIRLRLLLLLLLALLTVRSVNIGRSGAGSFGTALGLAPCHLLRLHRQLHVPLEQRQRAMALHRALRKLALGTGAAAQ